MGETTARAFRDKLAMRSRARAAGIVCPEFVHVVNDATVTGWIGSVPTPWVLKPRGQAAAIGIIRIASAHDLWTTLSGLGDARADYVLEQFVPGDVFHVDSLVFNRKVMFASASAYGSPPMAVAHEGGIFVTRTLPPEDPLTELLITANARVLGAFGLVRGVSHTEFIRGHDGALYFLETSARVGGAFIVEVVEASTGINLWREWAKIEIAGEHGEYAASPSRQRSAGIVLSLARQEHPDMQGYTDPEIVRQIHKRHHAGLIVAADDERRIRELLDSYVARFYHDFHASAPVPERAVD
jgi:biotin carboxylase